MENQEARKILEEQFKLLSEESKRCEPKCLHNITNAMLSIYTTLYPCQYDFEVVEKTAPEVPVQEQFVKDILSEISILLVTASSLTKKALENRFND